MQNAYSVPDYRMKSNSPIQQTNYLKLAPNFSRPRSGLMVNSNPTSTPNDTGGSVNIVLDLNKKVLNNLHEESIEGSLKITI